MQRGQQRAEKAVQPGQSARALVTVTNSGNVPTAYAVEVSPGTTLPGAGFAEEATFVLLTNVVQPGQSATIPVPLAIPPGAAVGRKVVRVRIGEAGATGEIANLLDEQFFTGLLRVEGPEPLPPSLPLPGEGRLSRGDILLGNPTVSPPEPQPGQVVTVRLPVTNRGPAEAPVRLEASIVNAAGAPVVELAQDAFTPGKGAPLTRVYNAALPVDLSPGSYGLDVSVVDQLTSAPLASQTFPNLFRIVSLPAPKAPTNLVPGNLDLLDPQVTPSVAKPGQIVELRLPFLNTGPVAPPLNLQAFLTGPGGKTYELPRQTFTPTLAAPATPTLRWRVPQEAAPGPYDLQVFAWDDRTFVPGDPSTYLIREQMNDLFLVEALPGPTVLRPGNLDLLDPQVDATVVQPGQTVEIKAPILNTGPVAPPVNLSAFILGPEGTAVASLPQQTFTPTLNVTALPTVRWAVPQNAAQGSYGLQVFVWDDKTFVPGDPSTYLVREQVNDLFRVQAAPSLPSLKPGDLGTPSLQFTPNVMDVGAPTQGRLSIPSLAGSPFTGLVDVSLVDASGNPVRSLVERQGLDFQPRSAGSLALPLDTAEMAPGTYGAHVEVRDITGSQVLLVRDLPSVLQVRVPAGIRGVNEVTEVRWFYDAVIEPPDPRLISIGPPPPLPIPKTAGAPTGGLVTFMHRGEGGLFDVGYGIAPARLTGHGRPFRFFTRRQFRVPSHPVPTPVAVDIPPSGWPSTAIAPAGRYDAQKFIDRVDLPTRQTVYQNWDDDVFEVP